MFKMNRITGEQVRMARALLEKGLSAKDFGLLIGVSGNTVHRLESCEGQITGDVEVVEMVQTRLIEALEKKGWQFLENGGIAPLGKQ